MATLENALTLGTDRPTKRVSMSKSGKHASTTISENSCAVTMVYSGPPPVKSNGPYRFKVHADEVLILQSHTDMGVKSVFKGSLKPDDVFTFKSCRLIDRHFAVTIYINGMIDQHVFVCCERGFVSQSHFSTKWSSCQLQSITGGVPCEICQSHELMNFRPNEVEYAESISYIPVHAVSTLPLAKPSSPTKAIKEDFSEVSNLPMITTDATEKSSSKSVASATKDNQFTDTSKITTSQAEKEEVNAQEDQSSGNVKVAQGAITEFTQTNSKDNSKILNEDKNATISSGASLAVAKLLTEYVKVFLPKKSTETEDQGALPISGSESLAHSNPTGSSREMKAAVQYEGSPSMPTAEINEESFVLIWLDETIQKNQDTVATEQRLRAIVNSLHTCHQISVAVDVISRVKEQQVYLIVSGGLGKQLVTMKDIVDSPKLNSIYIFCHDRAKYEALVQSCEKVRGVFVEINPLCARLKEDTEQALKNLLPISTSAGASADEKNQEKLLYAQLRRDLLLTMESNNNALLELTDFCASRYRSTPLECKHIQELKDTYHAGKVLHWYTRQTFLYKMLNTAFYTRDILILHKFNFFIKDLHTRLEQMHSLYKPTLKSGTFTVYRGLSMTPEYFEKTIRAEVNNLIAFDSFLSTSSSEKVAKLFALEKQAPKTESVVFYITVDIDRMDRPFADISRWSAYEKEEEILFSIGTVFRIDQVATEKTADGIWIVRLSTVGEKEEQLKNETEQMQTALVKFFEEVLHEQREANNTQLIPVSYANLASMFYKKGVYEESLKMYTKALDSLNALESPDPLTKATYISNIAKTHAMLEHTTEALTLYQDALHIRRASCEPNDPSLMHTFHTIAQLYRAHGKWDEALEQYRQVLQLEKTARESNLELDPATVAATLICMGNILHLQSKHAEARECFCKALTQQHAHLSKDHPVLAFLYNNIGVMCYKMKEYELALENQLQCLKIETEMLPETDKTFIDTYKNIATTYEKLRKWNEAEEFARKYLDQSKIHYSEGSPQLKEAIEFHRNIKISRDNRQ